jgi:2,3,4,5-tetrahydropyridine-2-carboxylate N-succinyltransferase/tetrahydrodipicolinate N-acetyltransferase
MVDECDRRNSAIPLLDLRYVNARIEPGAILREQVEIGDGAVIMMGRDSEHRGGGRPGTMIDMGAVLGGRATVGARCHIGAGAVLAGVVEPASAVPVVVEDEVLVAQTRS